MRKVRRRTNKQILMQNRSDNFIPRSARKQGITIINAKGGGKSRLSGREITFQDMWDGVPTIILDPMGGTIDEFLDKTQRVLAQLRRQGQITAEEEQHFWKTRIRYCDMSARNGYVTRFPALYKYPDESFNDAATRFTTILEMHQPTLVDAAVRGPALKEIAVQVVTVLLALGYGITEARELLTLSKNKFNKRWKSRLEELKDTRPEYEVQQACNFFLYEYPSKSAYDKERLTALFLGKLTNLFSDDTSRAMHAGSTPGIDWQEVVDKRQVVLLDFRHESNREKKRFKLLLAFVSFRDFLIRRNLREKRPISFIIDELPSMYALDIQTQTSIFGAEIVTLLDELSRNLNCWVTTLCQHIGQVDERSLQSLLSCGTVAIGAVANYEQAEMLAKNFFELNPYWIKRYNYAIQQMGGTTRYRWGNRDYTSPPRFEYVPLNPVEFTPAEQWAILARNFMKPGRFQYIVKFPGKHEGNINGQIGFADFNNNDRDIWVDRKAVAKRRAQLLQNEEPITTEASSSSYSSTSVPPEQNQTEEDQTEPEPAPHPVKPAPEVLTPKAQTTLQIFDQALEAVTQLPLETWSLLNGDKPNDTNE